MYTSSSAILLLYSPQRLQKVDSDQCCSAYLEETETVTQGTTIHAISLMFTASCKFMFTDKTLQIDWQWPLSGVLSIMMVNLSQPSEDGGAPPPPFTLSTITSKFGLKIGEAHRTVSRCEYWRNQCPHPPIGIADQAQCANNI